MNDNKISFIVYGVFFLILPVIHLGNTIINDAPVPLLNFYSLVTVAVMSFCFAYLAPNFSRNSDEGKYEIVRKSVTAGFIALLASIAIAFLLRFLNFLDIHPFHLVMILITILVSAAFISAVVYTKRNLGTG